MPAIKIVAFSGRKAWVLRNDSGRSIAARF
jgi:hypothetical protein